MFKEDSLNIFENRMVAWFEIESNFDFQHLILKYFSKTF